MTEDAASMGRLLGGLPFQVPLPEGSRVLGGVVRSARAIEFTVETALPWEQVRRFYDERLLGAGWQRASYGGPPSLRDRWQETVAPYARGMRGPSIVVRRVQDAPTQVRLLVSTDRRDPPGASGGKGSIHLRCPPLQAPTGAWLRERRSRASRNRVEDHYLSRADWPLADCAEALFGQLAGHWQSVARGEEGHLAWSTWAFREESGDSWQGLCAAIRWPGDPAQYAVEVVAEWDGEEGAPLVPDAPTATGPVPPEYGVLRLDELGAPRLTPPTGTIGAAEGPGIEGAPDAAGGYCWRARGGALLESDLDLPAVAAHYAGQLAVAGAEITGQGMHPGNAWYAWISHAPEVDPFGQHRPLLPPGHTLPPPRPAGDWRMLLCILSWPGRPRRYVVRVYGER